MLEYSYSYKIFEQKRMGEKNMKKEKILIIFTVLLLSVISVFIYFLKFHTPSDAYEGMSVIVEKTKDIPFYEGLRPKDAEYYIKGDKTKELFDYYSKNLPKNGWNEINSTFNSKYLGFTQDWEKEGQILHLVSQFNKDNNRTYILFDKREAPKSIVFDFEELCLLNNDNTNKTCLNKKSSQLVESFIEQLNNSTSTELPKDLTKKASFRIEPQNVIIDIFKDNTTGQNNEIYYAEVNGEVRELKPESELIELINLE
jgi:hypothetical protein